MANKDKYFPIEKILDQRIQRGKVQYLIKWMGYSSKYNSWEPKSSVIKIQPKEVTPKKPRTKGVSRSITKKNTKAVSRLTKKTSTTAASGSNAPQPVKSSRKNNTKTVTLPRTTTNTTAETISPTINQNSTDTNPQISRTILNTSKYHDIDKILGKRIVNNQIEYLVRWKGYPIEESSWEPENPLKGDHGERERCYTSLQHVLSAMSLSRTIPNATKCHDIDKILGKRIVNNQIEYLVRWKGYPTKESSWKPEKPLKRDHCERFCTSLQHVFSAMS